MNRHVRSHLATRTTELMGRAGFYEGAEVVTARFQVYGECNVKVASCSSPALLSPIQ